MTYFKISCNYAYDLCKPSLLHDNNFILPNFIEVNKMEGYCVKCKAKREMKDEKQVTMKNGRPATQGTCSVCGTKMFKIGGNKK